MKTLIIISAFMLSAFSCFTQEKLSITPDGVKPIVQSMDSVSASELYKRALNWVQETYKNPDLVLKMTIENQKIRVSAFKKGAWFYKSIGIANYYDMDYSMVISFKDGRYRLEFIVGQFYQRGGKVAHQTKHFFKSNGEIRGMYSDAVPSLNESMNALAKSFYDYVSGTTQSNDEDW